MALKLKQLPVEQKLKFLGLLIFTPAEFKDVFSVPLNTARSYIKRNVARGLFIKLRSSFYQLADSHPSPYFIANKLYQPSYVSLEKALSRYGVIPETVYAITSVTAKPTREYENPRGVFTYQKIKRSAFAGYAPIRIEGSVVLMAEAEKALADYLYFVDLKRISLNDRLELAGVRKAKLLKYAKLFNRPSLLSLVEKIYAESRKPRTIH